MKRSLRWLGRALLVLLVVLIGLVLARDEIAKVLAKRTLQESTGLRAEIGQFKTTLGSASLQMRDLKLYNPVQFGGTLMASVPELVVDLDASQVADGRLHFRNLKLSLAELNVVKNAQGRLNLEGVEKAVREHLLKRKRKKGQRFEFEFAGIDQMQLTVGKVLYTDLQRPGRSRALELAIRDEVVTGLKTEEDLQTWAGAILFRVLMQASLKPSHQQPSREGSGFFD